MARKYLFVVLAALAVVAAVFWAGTVVGGHLVGSRVLAAAGESGELRTQAEYRELVRERYYLTTDSGDSAEGTGAAGDGPRLVDAAGHPPLKIFSTPADGPDSAAERRAEVLAEYVTVQDEIMGHDDLWDVLVGAGLVDCRMPPLGSGADPGDPMTWPDEAPRGPYTANGGCVADRAPTAGELRGYAGDHAASTAGGDEDEQEAGGSAAGLLDGAKNSERGRGPAW